MEYDYLTGSNPVENTNVSLWVSLSNKPVHKIYVKGFNCRDSSVAETRTNLNDTGSIPVHDTKFIPHLQEGNRESQYAFCVKFIGV